MPGPWDSPGLLRADGAPALTLSGKGIFVLTSHSVRLCLRQGVCDAEVGLSTRAEQSAAAGPGGPGQARGAGWGWKLRGFRFWLVTPGVRGD